MEKPQTLSEMILFLERFRRSDTLIKTLEKMELEEIGDGTYSDCFRFKNHLVKVSECDNFKELIGSIHRKKLFKQYSVPPTWIHPKGFALICPYVKIKRKKVSWSIINKLENLFEKEMDISLCDLHEGNIVHCRYRGKEYTKIVDYGCFG